jgi:hypothetical protein
MDNNVDTINSDNADSDSESDDGLAHKIHSVLSTDFTSKKMSFTDYQLL